MTLLYKSGFCQSERKTIWLGFIHHTIISKFVSRIVLYLQQYTTSQTHAWSDIRFLCYSFVQSFYNTSYLIFAYADNND